MFFKKVPNIFMKPREYGNPASFAPQGRLQGVDDEEKEEEDSFVWRAVKLLTDCGKAWHSRCCIAVA